MFLITNDTKAYLWIGNECHESYHDLFYQKANSYVKTLQKFEHFPEDIQEVKQGEEEDGFWKIFSLEQTPEPQHEHNTKWNDW